MILYISLWGLWSIFLLRQYVYVSRISKRRPWVAWSFPHHNLDRPCGVRILLEREMRIAGTDPKCPHKDLEHPSEVRSSVHSQVWTWLQSCDQWTEIPSVHIKILITLLRSDPPYILKCEQGYRVTVSRRRVVYSTYCMYSTCIHCGTDLVVVQIYITILCLWS